MMNAQQLEYVRIELSAALADVRACTKGQLAAFEDSPLAETSKFKRREVRTVQIGKRHIQRWVDPVFCAETRSRRRPAPPIDPETFSSSSWRRALGMLPREQQAWLRYAYGFDLDFTQQRTLCFFVTNAFENSYVGRAASRKVRERCCRLVWLAIQQSSGMLWRYDYSACELAALVDVKPDNWSKHYASRWIALLSICEQLDHEALRAVSKQRTVNWSVYTA